MDITKIKFSGDDTTVHYMVDATTTTKETMIKSTEERAPEFTKQMEAIAPLVGSMLGFDRDYAKGFTATGVSLSYNDSQGMGCVITIRRELEKMPLLIINTPYVHEDMADTGFGGMPTVLAHEIKKLIGHAEKFVRGARRSGNLFVDDPGEIAPGRVGDPMTRAEQGSESDRKNEPAPKKRGGRTKIEAGREVTELEPAGSA